MAAAGEASSVPAFVPQANHEAKRGLREVEWLAETLAKLLGTGELHRLREELGL